MVYNLFNMKRFSSLFWLILFLTSIVSLLVFNKFFHKPQNKEEIKIPPPTSSIFLSPTPIIKKEMSQEELFEYLQKKHPSLPLPSPTEISEKMKIILLLPVITEEYTIEYLPNIDKFFVSILKNPFEVYKKEVENWFYSHGVKNLEELNIIWNTPLKGRVVSTPAP